MSTVGTAFRFLDREWDPARAPVDSMLYVGHLTTLARGRPHRAAPIRRRRHRRESNHPAIQTDYSCSPLSPISAKAIYARAD